MRLTSRTVAWAWIVYGVLSFLSTMSDRKVVDIGGVVFIIVAVYVLKRRLWAWGALVAFSAIYTLAALVGISLYLMYHGHPIHSKYFSLRIHSVSDLATAAFALVLCATSLLTLVRDKPSGYRHPSGFRY